MWQKTAQSTGDFVAKALPTAMKLLLHKLVLEIDRQYVMKDTILRVQTHF